MAETCRSYAHRYVGKGAERKLYEGPCVLEIGHDMDHLPYALAMEQSFNQAYNQGVTDALAKVAYMLGLHGPETVDLANEIIPEVEKVKR